MRTIFAFLILTAPHIVTAQPLFLYKTAGNPAGYLLNWYTNDRNGFFSHVIIAEGFSVQCKNAFCEVTLSNAYTYQTKLSGGPFSAKTNEIDQIRIRSETIKMDFPASTDIVFNNARTHLSQVRVDSLSKTNLLKHSAEAPNRRGPKQTITNTK